MIIKKDYSLNDYLKNAKKYLTDYYNRYYPFNQSRTIALEKRIMVDLDSTNNHQLCVYIDRVTKTKDRVYQIHDYKTCSHLPSNEFFQKDWQLTLYAIVLKEKYSYIKNIYLIWHFLKFDKEIKMVRSNEELEKLKKDIMMFIDNIKNTEEFPANPSKLCEWCKFKSICRYI